MFSTCMFCNRSLGSNDVIEHFPVGRRLAFDAERGRLWVVCQKCERWNLSPLDERWEAVEACERLFRDTRVRVSTENVGLARHAEGLELVRIGRPMRPEFAAWRYGDQFGRRRRKAILYGVGGAAALMGLTTVGATLMAGSGMGGYVVWQLYEGWASSRTHATLRPEDDRPVKLKRDDLLTTRLRPAEGGDGFRLAVLKGKKERWFEGEEAKRFAALILPKMNRSGGRKGTVRSAVGEIEHHGHPEQFLADVVAGDRFHGKKQEPGYVSKMPAPTRLALEMALHEEDERRALEGELWRLERAWEAAEEIAAISDDLLVPAEAGQFIERHRDSREESREREDSEQASP